MLPPTEIEEAAHWRVALNQEFDQVGTRTRHADHPQLRRDATASEEMEIHLG